MEITLRPWRIEDAVVLAELCNRVDRTYLSNRMPSPYKVEHAELWLSMIQPLEGRGSLFRAIVADGRVVGNISLERLSDVQSCDGILGYYLLTEYWGKGIVTEAVRQLREEAFRLPGLLRITAQVFAPNTGSRRVLEKNGFVLEGIQRKAVCKNGQVYDLCIYGSCRDEAAEQEEATTR